jgi:two-component system phosphate regulon response regulator PhoB
MLLIRIRSRKMNADIKSLYPKDLAELHRPLFKEGKGPSEHGSSGLSGAFSAGFSSGPVENSVLAFPHMAGERILLIEDEPDIAEVLQYNLEKEGFQVELAHRGDTGLEAVRRENPDLILLDLMLPGLDGLEVTRLLKRDPATSHLPIVMLTARSEELDRIVGLELGADDYISKPFSPREVVLRVKAVLRRLQPEEAPSSDLLQLGGIELDVSGHQLRVRGREVPLTATEFRLLRLLLERSGRVQTRGHLLSDVWGYAEDIDSRTVDTHIRRLRRKLGPEADRIETVIGVGYRLRP